MWGVRRCQRALRLSSAVWVLCETRERRIVTPVRPAYNPGVKRHPGWYAGRAMSVHSVRPRVSDLVFQLYGRPLHPELFDILAVRKVQRDRYTLTVWITRTGHVISWDNRDTHLTEVAAAADQELPASRRLLARRLRSEHSDAVLCAGGINYQVSFQVEPLPPEIFLHVHDEIVADGGKRGHRRGARRLPVHFHVPHLPRRTHGRENAVAD
jgi:hypothetical protein